MKISKVKWGKRGVSVTVECINGGYDNENIYPGGVLEITTSPYSEVMMKIDEIEIGYSSIFINSSIRISDVRRVSALHKCNLMVAICDLVGSECELVTDREKCNKFLNSFCLL